MEFETSSASHQPKIPRRLLSATVPLLFIAISYVDPGKWAAATESGARFGSDLVLPVLIFNFAAILCHYMSARIAVITGKDLAQICSEEYDNITCIFLGAQAEVSMIALDLMMVLGTAYGLNILFGIDLFTGVFLTAVNAALFPFLAILIEHGRVKFLSTCLSISILLFHFCGVFTSQSGNALSMGGMLTRLSGENAFALMSLLGAHIMPHNFYLHSSIVQKDKQLPDVPKGALCYDHFFAVLCIFSGIYLVNYLLMNSAANVFYTTGLLNFQDALSLLDQVFRSSVAPMALIVLMFFSNQITALSWNLGGQVVVNSLFKLDIPGWLHHATIRILAIIPALCCVWNSGAEGIYQMLIFAQVVVALMLPSSVIPLFRIASSRAVMGIYKTSQFEDLLVLITCVGMLGLKVIFFIELMFGNSDWVTNLRWNTGSSVPIAYVFLVSAGSVSFCLWLWLAATPLKSATFRIDTQVLEWDIRNSVPEAYVEEELNDVRVSKYTIDKPREPLLVLEKSLGSFPDLSATSHNLNLPDTLYDSENGLHVTSGENIPEISNSGSSCHEEVSVAEGDANSDTINRGEGSDNESQGAHALKRESVDVVEKTLTMEGELQNPRDDGNSWESEEPTKGIPETNQSLISEGPGSFRSLSGKNDDAGSGTGSLSRVAGLGRTARRQLTVILDEFWGQMFDFHGQATEEAKAKKLDVLLGFDLKEDLKPSSASLKLDSNRKDPPGFFPSAAGGTDSLMTSASALYNSPGQQGHIMLESSFGVQRGSSSLWSPPPTQLLDTYLQSCSPLDPSERRYPSMRIPASSDGYDQQPATVHGYQLRSYLNRITQESGSGFSNGQIESLAPKSTSSVMLHYGDSFARPLGRKTPNGVSSLKPPGFHNIPVSRNSSLQADKLIYELASPKPAENVNTSAPQKKYYSLPDISGLRIPSHQDATLLDRRGQWDNPVVAAAAYGQTVGSSAYERTYSGASTRGGALSGFRGISPEVCRDAFPLQIRSGSNTGSLWSRQPFEQFGVADKNVTDSNTQETASVVYLEAKLLQSFRYCIMKILKLDGSDRLFRQNDGADEDLIDRVAARERFLYEAESEQINRPNNASFQQFYSEADHAKFLVTSVPHCGEGCVYKMHLIVSFGVWCIHRVLDLSLMESRPELWGKYTYVLNRLQGIVDPAFFKPRSPTSPCLCLQLPDGWQQKSSPPISNGSLPPHSKQGRGKCTTAAMVLEMIKDVEIAISCRKGRTGTAAGDVAFPRGKENLASVLKRYKRRLNKPIVSQESGSVSRKVSSPLQYGS